MEGTCASCGKLRVQCGACDDSHRSCRATTFGILDSHLCTSRSVEVSKLTGRCRGSNGTGRGFIALVGNSAASSSNGDHCSSGKEWKIHNASLRGEDDAQSHDMTSGGPSSRADVIHGCGQFRRANQMSWSRAPVLFSTRAGNLGR